MRWLVSVESLPVPARSAALKALLVALDLAVADSEQRSSHPFAQLLHRVTALSKTSGNALSRGSWILSCPRDPDLAALYTDMAGELTARLLTDPVRHLLVVLEADADEAFEAAVLGESKSWTLRSCRDAGNTLSEARPPVLTTPFPHHVLKFRCPPFVADNPVTLASFLDLITQACQQIVGAPSTDPLAQTPSTDP